MTFPRNPAMKAALSQKTAMASRCNPIMKAPLSQKTLTVSPPQPHHESSSFIENRHGVPPHPCDESSFFTETFRSLGFHCFHGRGGEAAGLRYRISDLQQATLQIAQSKVGFVEVRAGWSVESAT
jgi:hypothetical protein